MAAKVALLLEDEALIALDVGQGLIEEGYFVHTFMSCATALKWLESKPPIDVAVIDVELADGSCHKIAELLTDRRIPFVVHSAMLGPLGLEGPFTAGTLLPKPSRTDALITAVRLASDRRSAT